MLCLVSTHYKGQLYLSVLFSHSETSLTTKSQEGKSMSSNCLVSNFTSSCVVHMWLNLLILPINIPYLSTGIEMVDKQASPVLFLNVEWILVFETINSFNSLYNMSNTVRTRCGKRKMLKISFYSASHLWTWCSSSFSAGTAYEEQLL